MLTDRVQRRRWNFVLGCTAVAAVGACVSYHIYHPSSLASKRRQFSEFLAALSNLSEAVRDCSSCVSLVCKDLHSFLASETDEVPRSLKQVLKLARSEEFEKTLVAVTGGLLQGVVCGLDDQKQNQAGLLGSCTDQHHCKNAHASKTCKAEVKSQVNAASLQAAGDGDFSSSQFLDLSAGIWEKLLGQFFSPAGKGFASAVVGTATRNLVMTVLEFNQTSRRKRNFAHDEGLRFDMSPTSASQDESIWKPLVESVLDFSCTSRGKLLVSECVQMFVGTAVAAYLEKTRDVNLCEEFVAGVTKPGHKEPVIEILTSVCSSAVEALVRTSHEVLSGDSCASSLPPVAPTSSNQLGRVSGFSRILAMPSNRQLVLEVAGTMSSQAVRSFCEVLISTVCTALRIGEQEGGGMWRVQQQMGLAARAVAAKSLLVMTISVAICLHLVMLSRER